MLKITQNALGDVIILLNNASPLSLTEIRLNYIYSRKKLVTTYLKRILSLIYAFYGFCIYHSDTNRIFDCQSSASLIYRRNTRI